MNNCIVPDMINCIVPDMMIDCIAPDMINCIAPDMINCIVPDMMAARARAARLEERGTPTGLVVGEDTECREMEFSRPVACHLVAAHCIIVCVRHVWHNPTQTDCVPVALIVLTPAAAISAASTLSEPDLDQISIAQRFDFTLTTVQAWLLPSVQVTVALCKSAKS
eukprot:6183035-Pleurochrysis_carterae.AAC.1